MKLKEETVASSMDPDEIAKFSAMADAWWDPDGPCAPLHRIHPLRVHWIKERLEASGFRLQDITLLDIGCGGGLVAESMAAMGAKVTAIDASEANIAVAKLHAANMGLAIDYQCATAESLLPSPGFEVVTALEIIEHVADVRSFVRTACAHLAPGGQIFFSTINRTAKAYALAILAAEHVLRWVPKGTHEWHKFVKPHELVRALEAEGIEIIDMRGMVMHPIRQTWCWEPHDLSVNYAVSGRKPKY